MRPLSILFILSTLLPLALSGCGSVRNLSAKRAEKQRREALTKLTETSAREASSRLGEKAVGSITYADDVYGFVHVKVRTGAMLAPGTRLELRRDGAAVAEVKISPEANKANAQFVIADILSGAPARGDIAFPLTGPNPATRLVPVDTEKRPSSAPSSSPATSPAAAVASPAESSAPLELPPLDDPGMVEMPGEAVRIQKAEDVIRERAAFPQGAPPPSPPVR